MNSFCIIIDAGDSSQVLQDRSKVAIQLFNRLRSHHFLDGKILKQLTDLSCGLYFFSRTRIPCIERSSQMELVFLFQNGNAKLHLLTLNLSLEIS